MKRSLTEDQRMAILYSMVFIDKENQNLEPDVRTLLWLRASGAYQYIDTFKGYKVKDSDIEMDYYSALKKSPIPPSPSISLIYADMKRLQFDIDTVKKKHQQQRYLNFINNELMQNSFAEVMINYCKRNGAFLYNQSQSTILSRILEVVYKQE